MIDLFKEFDIDDHDDDNLVLMMIIIIYFFIIWPWQKSLNSFSYVNGILHSEKPDICHFHHEILIILNHLI